MQDKQVTGKAKIVEWCDQQVAEGKELALCWEGGGDSGWVFFEVDEEQVENEFTNALVDMMYDVLDYGSWAGEFSAEGKAKYNAETKCFEGIDYYGEDVSIQYSAFIEFKVPEDLWFDQLEWSYQDDSVEYVTLAVRNGFTTPRHEDVEKKLQEHFKKEVERVTEEFINDPETEEFRSIWDDGIISRSEFVKKGKYLVATLDTISISSSETNEKDVCLDLTEFLNLEKDEENEEV